MTVQQKTLSKTPLVGSLAIALGVISIGGLTQRAQAQATQFATITQPVGLAATTTRLLATSFNSAVISQISSAGVVTPFHTIPAQTGSVLTDEMYLAVSPGLGGFTTNNIFAIRGRILYEISADGSSHSTFLDFTSLITGGAAHNAIHTGITFDKVGTFGNNLIVTFDTGQIFTVSSTKVVTALTTTPALAVATLEGPAVAPAAFTVAPGSLLVTQEDLNTVWKISSAAGHAATSIPITDPESVHFVPTNVCAFGTSNAAFFTADLGNNRILSYPPSAFSTLANYALIPIEFNGGIKKVSPTGVVGDFDTTAVANREGSTFVDCAVAPRLDGRMTGGGSVFTTGGVRVTHGFELHCDVADLPNRLEINWDGGNNFHLENLVTAFCFLDPNINAGHPTDTFNTYVGSGTGTLNGFAGASATWTFTDAGEPGTNDVATITIKDQGGATVLTVSGKLDKGNQQAHLDNK
ncbi:MAG: hypothetical protein JWO19_3369 [Bryobacterales bacterium]|nr:hypothetical protein [Bryobacterales bacterium]